MNPHSQLEMMTTLVSLGAQPLGPSSLEKETLPQMAVWMMVVRTKPQASVAWVFLGFWVTVLVQ